MQRYSIPTSQPHNVSQYLNAPTSQRPQAVFPYIRKLSAIGYTSGYISEWETGHTLCTQSFYQLPMRISYNDITKAPAIQCVYLISEVGLVNIYISMGNRSQNFCLYEIWIFRADHPVVINVQFYN